jgi:hypothetical protein
MEGISFFSESDMTRKADGTKIIASEYPAWYNDQIFDEIKEDKSVEETSCRYRKFETYSERS